MSFKGSSQSRVVVETQLGSSNISFEAGWVAKQASGAVIVRQGETMILCTVCTTAARKDQDFFPLVVEYQERTYAAGRIPGGFFKREGRPTEGEILSCRLIDRPIRPLFPDDYLDEVQIICTVISADGVHSPDVLAICGASAALTISKIPFLGPIAAVRVGRVDGKFVINPSPAQLKKSDLEIVVAGTQDSIVMVEGGAQIVPEAEILNALDFGHAEIKRIIAIQEDLRTKVGVEKIIVPEKEVDGALLAKVNQLLGARLEDALRIKEKQVRNDTIGKLKGEIVTALAEEFPEQGKAIHGIFDDQIMKIVRRWALKDGVRIDGRNLTTVRPIECQVGFIPRTHGSALFTRGETQAIVSTTLGTAVDAQRIDSLSEQTEKLFMLHYNFPPYSTGEVKPMRGAGRREIGHGALAERALRNILPSQEKFPYVVRIVSEITESNGSSSMASVCGGALSLMDAGVPIKQPVSGVAMGLLKEGDDVCVLTDILGDEDHYGDMDFKVCGTKDGITALQMDIKCRGLSRKTMEQALEQALAARVHILAEMEKTLSVPKDDLSPYAPRIVTINIKQDKIREVIGPGGKVIQGIIAQTGVSIDIEDSGVVKVASPDLSAAKKAIELIERIIAEAEIGKVYQGVVTRVADFGAFVEILPGVEGLVHISQLENRRVEHVSDVVCEGDEVRVKVIDIDRMGRVRLSRKEVLNEESGAEVRDEVRDSQVN